MKPLHHAYMKYLDTLPKEQQAELIAENIKTSMRQTQYKAKCHDCKETFTSKHIDMIDTWCHHHNDLHDRLPQLTKYPVIEKWHHTLDWLSNYDSESDDND